MSEVYEAMTEEVGSGDGRRGVELKGTNWESLPRTASHGTTTRARTSLRPLLIITSTITHTAPHTQAPLHTLANEGMNCGSGNAISHSVGVGINLAAESLEGFSLQSLEPHSVLYSHFVMVWQFEVTHL